jgi:hypothetical protein
MRVTAKREKENAYVERTVRARDVLRDIKSEEGERERERERERILAR